jgi:hypothetical protein
VLPRFLSWASLRTLIVAAGLPFVALSLGSACLDYAGEDWGIEGCDTSGDAGTTSDAGTPGSGSGSGIIIAPPAADCGTTPPVLGSGSGSASGTP